MLYIGYKPAKAGVSRLLALRKPAFAGFRRLLQAKAGFFWPEAGSSLAKAGFFGQSRLLPGPKPASLAKAGFLRPKPASSFGQKPAFFLLAKAGFFLWPEAGLHRLSRLLSGQNRSRLWPGKPAYTGLQPALAREAGLHRLTAGFGQESRLTPASAGFGLKEPAYTGFGRLLARGSRLTPALAGSFLQGGNLFPPSSFKAQLAVPSSLRGPNVAEEQRQQRCLCGKPRRPSSEGVLSLLRTPLREKRSKLSGPPFRASPENAATMNENRPELCSGLPTEAGKRGRWPKRKLSWPPCNGEPGELTMSAIDER